MTNADIASFLSAKILYMRDLNTCRLAIDEIDGKLLDLLSQRKDVAADIAECKLQKDQKISDPAREQEKLDAIMEKARALNLPPAFAAAVFKTVIANTVSYEQEYAINRLHHQKIKRSTSVAYLGPKGTYSHLAAMRYLSMYTDHIKERDCRAFDEIVASVESGKSEYGLLPIENSSSGSINGVLDVLQDSKVSLVGEIFVPIDHAVLTCAKVNVGEITDIYSHPQPIEQCSRWLKDFMPKVNIHYMKSTSHAMEEVQKLNDPHCAAIASHHAGSYYGLLPIMDNIANNVHNYTRFVAISMIPLLLPESIDAKTSISFTVAKYTPGSLICVLNEFSKLGINLTKLTSRPKLSPGHDTWEEIFFADVQGNLSSPQMQNCLEKIRSYTGSLKILGCYASDERKRK